MLSIRAKAGSQFVFMPFWELNLSDLQSLDYQSFHSLGVSQVGSVLGPSADVWALASSCGGHYFPSVCPTPLLTLT